ncbi:hypothetical protein P6N53_13760 [Desulforamulus aquiferis]|uniref:Uncharacterized protein n=1 Tax=Desulforamulus aquiferis TaxID=1397668 RepID=A0AAW7ZG16_9FIRM|nr:hypothetical protein [Desulforamulus aquiferis]
MIFSSIVGGGVSETYLYPIYGGIVLLAGLIVICTVVILEEIKLIKDSLNKTEKQIKINRKDILHKVSI